MPSPFPGMDPYLEHPVLWEGLHARLVVAIANHLQPRLDPRYVASVEERVYIEGPQRRIPDVWIQRTRDVAGEQAVAGVGHLRRAEDVAAAVDVEEPCQTAGGVLRCVRQHPHVRRARRTRRRVLVAAAVALAAAMGADVGGGMTTIGWRR